MMTAEQLYAFLSAHGLTNSDIHTHTTFCDGKNTPAEMAEAAYAKGLACLGFSGHAHTAFDETWCMSKEGTARYRAEVMRLKRQYAGKMEILLGIEQDLYSDDSPAVFDYDYTVGSVHYLKKDGRYLPIDESPEAFQKTCAEHFGGDYLAMAEEYFAEVAKLSRLSICPTVIGHIDLISKFNRGNVFFDENGPRYLKAAYVAVDALLPTGALFEVNTGAIARGWRDEPYPAVPILEYIRAHGGKVILTGDTHRKENLCGSFERFATLIRR